MQRSGAEKLCRWWYGPSKLVFVRDAPAVCHSSSSARQLSHAEHCRRLSKEEELKEASKQAPTLWRYTPQVRSIEFATSVRFASVF